MKLFWLLIPLISAPVWAQSVAEAARAARKSAAATHGVSPSAPAPTVKPARRVNLTPPPPPVDEPENGVVANGVYANQYFSFSYPLPVGWIAGTPGPPPSETGYYVLSSFKQSPGPQGQPTATMLLAASDLFFVPKPAANAMELIKDARAALPPVYSAGEPASEVKISGHTFAQLDYMSPAAQLHWRVLATEIRCHVVEFVLISRDPKLLDRLSESLDEMTLPRNAGALSGTGGAGVPRCVKDYATGGNVLHRVEPKMAGPRYTSVPVRFVVGVDGRIKDIHVINGAPEQVKSVRDALAQWALKPYTRNGTPEEVETGLLFKFPPKGMKLAPVPEKY